MTPPAVQQPRRPALAWSDLAFLLYALIFAVWLAFFSRGDPATRDIVDCLFFIPPGIAVAWTTWRTARVWPHDPATRRAWTLIALSHFFLWAGGAAWSALLIFAPGLAVSKLADSLSLPSYGFALWGVLSFPGIYGDGSSRVRSLLDTALIFVGAGLGAWFFGYRLALSTTDATFAAMYIAVTLPAIDLALVLMMGTSYLRASQPTTRVALAWLIASKATVVAGDSYYGWLRLTTGYYPGHWIDLFWFASWILAWISARLVQERVARGVTAAEPERSRDYRSRALPYFFVLSAQGLMLWVLRDRLSTPAGSAALATAVITILIVLRQVAELRENVRLFEQERRQEARFSSLVQQGTDVLLVVDGAGGLLYLSPSAERLFGLREVPPRSLGMLFEAADAQALVTLIANLRPGQLAGPAHVRFRAAGGKVVHLDFLGIDLRADPAVQGVVLTGRDVSERKALEEELLHANKMRAIGQMAGGVAHDFNNILTALRGHVELLLSELPEKGRARADAVEIAHAADRAAAVTRQLLQFSRREVVRPSTLDLNAVVAGLEPMLRQLMPGPVLLRVELAPAPVWTFVDRSQLEQVVLNLAVNARDAMPLGGNLLLRVLGRLSAQETPGAAAAFEGEHAVLVVQDSGVGMSDATMSRIFEPFFTTKEQGQGTGLGLATVSGNVAGAGGRVLVESAPGSGSTFTVIFPLSQPPADAPSHEPARATAAGAGARVLVVEDDETVLRVTSRMLERKGYRVLQAHDGQQALDLLAQPGVEVDLILTDLMMRGVGGAQLIARLAVEAPDLPVICMSGHAADEASRWQAASGAAAFLPKPFTAAELFQVTAEVLTRRR